MKSKFKKTREEESGLSKKAGDKLQKSYTMDL